MEAIQISTDGYTARMPDGRTLLKQRRRYWSRVRLVGTRTGSDGAYVYTIPATTVRAFSYRIGDAVPGHSGSTATKADTNIERPRTPNQGDVVLIDSLGIEVLPRSDGDLLKEAMDRLVVSIEHSAGGNAELLGHLSAFPAGRGFAGGSDSKVGYRPIAGGPSHVAAAMQNGVPALQNVGALDVPLVWDGLSDSFAIAIEPTEAIALTTEMDSQAAGTGILGQTMPTGIFVDLLVHLIGSVFNPQPVQG